MNLLGIVTLIQEFTRTNPKLAAAVFVLLGLLLEYVTGINPVGEGVELAGV